MGDAAVYKVRVEGQVYHVEVADNGEVSQISAASSSPTSTPAPVGGGTDIAAPLSGNILKIVVAQGQQVNEGDVIVILEAMKMETEVRSALSGVVRQVIAKEGDGVQAGQTMMVIG